MQLCKEETRFESREHACFDSSALDFVLQVASYVNSTCAAAAAIYLDLSGRGSRTSGDCNRVTMATLCSMNRIVINISREHVGRVLPLSRTNENGGLLAFCVFCYGGLVALSTAC